MKIKLPQHILILSSKISNPVAYTCCAAFLLKLQETLFLNLLYNNSGGLISSFLLLTINSFGKQILHFGKWSKATFALDSFPLFRFTKFDLFTPAVTRGLPVTQVICRIALQNILVSAVGKDIVNNNSKVVDFVDDSNKV